MTLAASQIEYARPRTRVRSMASEHWNRWHLLGAVLMAAVGLAATWDAWRDMFQIAYTNEENSHIFLVPLVAGWMIWVRRMRVRHCKPSGTMVGALMVLAGWGLSLFGFYHGVQSFWHGGAVIMVLGCMLSVLGKNALFRFFPAIAVMVFFIPVPERIRLNIAMPLQAWLAQIAQKLLSAAGVEVERTGYKLLVNGTEVMIAEACNGMRMVFALILVVYAFSFGLPLRNGVRFVVLLLSPLAAFVCNVIRILPTAYIYGYYSKTMGDAFHEYAGWAMLPIAFLMLYGIIQLMKWAMIPVQRYTLASQGQG
ncbi:MAG TPA: exosortase/archaeosortase family protein [Tepidisphaeraceae bacterium]|jgi:exosortase